MRLAALILAAGESSRFAGCKVLASIDGVPVLQRAIDLAESVLPGSVFVVSGAWHEAVQSAFDNGELAGATLLHNPRWQTGLSTSLAHGITVLAPDSDGVLVLLADQVALLPADLQALLKGFDGQRIHCGFYQGRRAVPAVFGRIFYPALMSLEGDQGARVLLNDPAMPIEVIDLPNAALDIDTRAQLADWQSNRIV